MLRDKSLCRVGPLPTFNHTKFIAMTPLLGTKLLPPIMVIQMVFHFELTLASRATLWKKWHSSSKFGMPLLEASKRVKSNWWINSVNFLRGDWGQLYKNWDVREHVLYLTKHEAQEIYITTRFQVTPNQQASPSRLAIT